jgi:predicted kinase
MEQHDMITDTGSQKSLILLRGLPGCGKTTLAEILSENGKYPVYSIDSYFTHPETGEYSFDYKNNHHAYKQCETQSEEAMIRCVEKIFIDNCFTLEWEMQPYIDLAEKFGYRLFVVTVENRHGGTNVHGISDEQIEKMAQKYKIHLSGR